jgi:hypothetical protein
VWLVAGSPPRRARHRGVGRIKNDADFMPAIVSVNVDATVAGSAMTGKWHAPVVLQNVTEWQQPTQTVITASTIAPVPVATAEAMKHWCRLRTVPWQRFTISTVTIENRRIGKISTLFTQVQQL